MNTRPSPARTGGPDPKVIGGVVAGVLVLVIASIIFVVIADSEDSAVDSGGEYGIVTVQGEALPMLTEGNDRALGRTGPTVISERSTGQVRLEPDETDQPIMAVFLAHWCPRCQAELPLLVEMADDGAFDGIRTVAVLTGTTESRPNFPPSAWLDDEGWTGDRLFDDEESTGAAAYGLSGFPLLVFMDADGTVVQRLDGEQPRDVIEAAVDAAKAGT